MIFLCKEEVLFGNIDIRYSNIEIQIFFNIKKQYQVFQYFIVLFMYDIVIKSFRERFYKLRNIIYVINNIKRYFLND